MFGSMYENMVMLKIEHLSMYDHSAKCGISLWECLYQEFSAEENRAVYVVWKQLYDNTDACLISATQSDYESLLSSIFYYYIKLGHQKKTWLNCIISFPVEVSLLPWFHFTSVFALMESHIEIFLHLL